MLGRGQPRRRRNAGRRSQGLALAAALSVSVGMLAAASASRAATAAFAAAAAAAARGALVARAATNLTESQLRERLKELGRPTNGPKAELIRRFLRPSDSLEGLEAAPSLAGQRRAAQPAAPPPRTRGDAPPAPAADPKFPWRGAAWDTVKAPPPVPPPRPKLGMLLAELQSESEFNVVPGRGLRTLPARALQALRRAVAVEPSAEILIDSSTGVGKQVGVKELRFPLEALDSLRDEPSLEPYFGTASLPPRWAVDAVLRGASLASGAGEAAGNTSADGLLEDVFTRFPELRKQLRESQLEAVRFAVAREGRALLADEMGLGKSLTALVVAQIYAEEWPVLVVAPKSVVLNWKREVRRWMPALEEHTQALITDGAEPELGKMIVLGSYDQVTRRENFQVRHDGKPYEVVVIDEAHYLKSPETARASKILPICKRARRCILLSGTPVMNCAAEAWSLLAALMPDRCGSFEDFCDRYSVQDTSVEGTPRQTGVRCSKELHLLMSALKIRRRKRDALPDLKKKKRIVKKISLDRIDSKFEEKLTNLLKRQRYMKSISRRGVSTDIYSLSAAAKADAVADYVSDLLDQEDKVVVFAHHHVLLNAVEERLQAERHSYIRVDGKVSQKSRAGMIESFQTDASVRVAIMAITAAGQGISLTAARVAVFGELHWVPGKLIQAEDRVHRSGQVRDVEIHYLVLPGSDWIDEKQLKLLQKKDGIVDRIVEGEVEKARFSSEGLDDKPPRRPRAGGGSA